MRFLLLLAAAPLLAAPPFADITADALRGHVSFLASDALEGRDTPSKGLDVAAEYIASRFRAASLKPAGDNGTYFQQAAYVTLRPAVETLELTEGEDGVPIYKLAAGVTPKAEEVEGKVVVTTGMAGRMLINLKPKAVVLLSSRAPMVPASRLAAADEPEPPLVFVTADAGLRQKFDAWPDGNTPARAKLPAERWKKEPVTLRNVAARIDGADAALKDSWVLLTAHYDHVGVRGSGEDRIFNGANDNASGTSSLLEAAAALNRMPAPKRSILFVAFFGEEKGLVGARYYTGHPIVPLAATVANVNLEHMGRTDMNEGDYRGKISVTGYDYTDMAALGFTEAASRTGIEIRRDPSNEEQFFQGSDNLALAMAGVPAHTLSAGYIFKEYHGAGDSWDKLDYDNHALVTRMAAAAVEILANKAMAPKWNAANPKTDRFREAAAKLARTAAAKP